METIDIACEGLGHILEDNKLYVPPYQRSYAWRTRHIESLLNDLAGAIRNKPDDGTNDYFLGSVVGIAKDGRLEIVDGQQRLATTSLILTAIRDQFLRAGDKEMADSIQDGFLRKFDRRTRESPPQMQLNEADNEFYQNWALALPKDRGSAAPPSKPSHRRIASAYRFAHKYFRGLWGQYSKSDASDALVDWVNFLRDHAQVIRVTVKDAGDAYVIFETLNDRGLEPSTADLLKNYLFGRSGNRIDETRERWAKMTGALETVASKEITVDYIRQLWGSTHGLTRKRELFYKIKDQVINQRTAVELSTALAANAKLYAAILNPNHAVWAKYGPSSRQAISTIRLLRMERLRPLLLSILSAFSDTEVKKSLQWLIAASVRLNITGGGSSGPTEHALASAAVRIRAKEIKDTSELAVELTRDNPVIPGDTVFQQAFAVARSKYAQMARFYLRTLEEAFLGGNEIYVLAEHEEKLNLEHILPESGRDQHWNHVPAERANELCRRLGNMVLLNPIVNARLESQGFQEKRIEYAKSTNTRLTQELAKRFATSEWGEDQINEWQQFLAKLAVQAWNLKVSPRKRKVGESNPSVKASPSARS